MKFPAALVGQCDDGVGPAEVAFTEHVAQCSIEIGCKIFAPGIRSHINAALHRPAVGRPFAVRGRISKTKYGPIIPCKHQVGETGCNFAHAVPEFRQGRNLFFETHSGFAYKWRVDLKDLRCVVFRVYAADKHVLPPNVGDFFISANFSVIFEFLNQLL